MTLNGWIRRIRHLFGNSEGQTMAEYAVILGVITPAILIGIALLAGNVTSAIGAVAALF